MKMPIFVKTKLYFLKEERAARRNFYDCESFRKVDEALLRQYRFVNPYRECRKFCGEHAYGETPLTTMGQVVETFEIGKGDRVIELGAGRGRTSLFLANFVGCEVLAYEEVPLFVEKLEEIAPSNLVVKRENYLEVEVFDASVIYLYGTMLDDRDIAELCDRFPYGAKIITVSYALKDYSDEYETVKTLDGSFPWGSTEVYWNERTLKEKVSSL